MKRTIKFSALVGALSLFATPALADSNSLLTVAVGTGFGFTQARDLQADLPNTAVSPDLNVRLRMLRVLAADFEMTPGRSASVNGDLVFDSTYRLSGLLYLVPLDIFGLYAKAGIGGAALGDVVSMTKQSNSYHAGGGLDVYIGDHISVGGEFLVLVPGVMSVERAIVRRAALTAEQSADTASAPASFNPLDELAVSDFVSPNNFRASLNVRYYF